MLPISLIQQPKLTMRTPPILQGREHCFGWGADGERFDLFSLCLSPLPPSLPVPGLLHAFQFGGFEDGDEGGEFVEAGGVPVDEGGGGEDGDEVGKILVLDPCQLACFGIPMESGLYEASPQQINLFVNVICNDRSIRNFNIIQCE